jgi:hypothetical protein
MAEFDAKIFNNLGGPLRAVGTGAGATSEGKKSDAEFAKLSNAEKLDYCRQFPQPLDGGQKK